jgi:tetratricopeptide (TPR) repeat protein
VGLYREHAAHAEAVRQQRLAERNAALASEQAQRADREAREARLNARIADAVNRLMTTTMQKADRAKEQGRADITVREVMDAAARELESGAAQEPRVELLLAKTIGETYRELSLFEPAERMLRIYAERSRQVFGASSLEYAGALNDLGSLLKMRGQLDAAARVYEQAGSIFAAIGEPAAGALAAMQINTGALAAAQNRPDDAERDLRRSVAYYESHPDAPRDEYFTALHNLAGVAFQRGDYPRAVALLKRVIELERAAFGSDDPRTLESLHGLTAALFSLGDPGAEASVREELAAARRLHGEEHEQVENLLHSLGTVLLRKGDLAGAEAAFRRSLEVCRKIYGAESRQAAARAAALAAALARESKFDQAESLFREAVPVLVGGDAGGWDTDTLFTVYQYGTLLERRGGMAEAEPLLRRAVEAAASLKDGSRHEWVRQALTSTLGGVVCLHAADPSLTADARLAKLNEAGSLALPAAERLLALKDKIGPSSRASVIAAALDRAVRISEALQDSEPTPAHAAALAQWRARRNAGAQESAGG